jgi:hypothetical protein
VSLTPTRWRWSRDSILFFAGLAGILHETVRDGVERPSLLLLFATMAGLPAFLRLDERRSQDRDQ